MRQHQSLATHVFGEACASAGSVQHWQGRPNTPLWPPRAGSVYVKLKPTNKDIANLLATEPGSAKSSPLPQPELPEQESPRDFLSAIS